MPAALPLILGLEGPVLSDAERAFFKELNPLGFILFRWNIKNAESVRALICDLKALLGRTNLPVLVDAEGGAVWRLPKSCGSKAPAPQTFGALFCDSADKALKACYDTYLAIGKQHNALGFTVNCAPLLDLGVKGAHDVIGSRAFSDNPSTVGALGLAALQGLKDAGITPVIKHLPGHGAANTDSHDACPVITLSKEELLAHLAPFQQCAKEAPWAMTAHCLYTAIDKTRPATFSPIVIQDVIRKQIGFQGFLITDDLYMGAVQNLSPTERVQQALSAGCDAALYGRGGVKVYEQAAKGLAPLSKETLSRLDPAFLLQTT
ncbi:MAG: glycoside hydrolase family 3 N-terminal domain-containing protein [Holosporaceae bacterium]